MLPLFGINTERQPPIVILLLVEEDKYKPTMKVIVFFALFAFAYGEYPAATPEIVEPADSYGPPPEVPAATYAAPAAPSDSYGAPVSAPLDSYAPPKKVTIIKAAPIAPTVAAPAATTVAAAPEILSAPEPVITETVAAAPAPSASFSFLSELAAPAVAPQTYSLPLAQTFHTGLVPPSYSLPQFQYLPPVQTYSVAPVRIALQAAAAPPVTIPPVNIPQLPAPAPLPPVSLPPLPIQPLPLETKTTAQITQFATLPTRSYYTPQYVLSAPTPVTYAPSFSNFFQSSALPTTFLSTPRITSPITTNTHILPEVTSFKTQPVTIVKSAPAIPRIPATSYGAPAFEKKK